MDIITRKNINVIKLLKYMMVSRYDENLSFFKPILNLNEDTEFQEIIEVLKLGKYLKLTDERRTSIYSKWIKSEYVEIDLIEQLIPLIKYNTQDEATEVVAAAAGDDDVEVVKASNDYDSNYEDPISDPDTFKNNGRQFKRTIDDGQKEFFDKIWSQIIRFEKLIFKYGDLVDKFGRSMLYYLTSIRNTRLIKLLCDAKKTKLSCGPEIFAYESDLLLKIKQELNMDLVSVFGDTAMHLAVENNDLDIVEILLAYNASITVKDYMNTTVFVKAIRMKNIPIISSIIDHYGTDCVDYQTQNNQLFFTALQTNYPEIVNLIINVKLFEDDYYEECVYLSGIKDLLDSSKNLDIIRLLLEKKPNIFVNNSLDDDVHSLLHESIKRDFVDLTELLIQYNINVNYKDEYGHTAIHLSIMKNKPDCFKILMKSAAAKDLDINAQARNGLTPLQLAIVEQMPDFVKILLENNADETVLDNDSNTSLHLATESNQENIFNLIKITKDNVNAENVWGNTPLFGAIRNWNINMIKKLMDLGADINHRNHKGLTVLHWLLEDDQNVYIDIIKIRFLLQNNANVNIPCVLGNTPLFSSFVLDNVEVFELLLLYDANIYHTNKQGINVIHKVVLGDYPKTLPFFVKNFDMNTKTSRGETPLILAVNHCRMNAIEQLVKSGYRIDVDIE